MIIIRKNKQPIYETSSKDLNFVLSQHDLIKKGRVNLQGAYSNIRFHTNLTPSEIVAWFAKWGYKGSVDKQGNFVWENRPEWVDSSKQEMLLTIEKAASSLFSLDSTKSSAISIMNANFIKGVRGLYLFKDERRLIVGFMGTDVGPRVSKRVHKHMIEFRCNIAGIEYSLEIHHS